MAIKVGALRNPNHNSTSTVTVNNKMKKIHCCPAQKLDYIRNDLSTTIDIWFCVSCIVGFYSIDVLVLFGYCDRLGFAEMVLTAIF